MNPIRVEPILDRKAIFKMRMIFSKHASKSKYSRRNDVPYDRYWNVELLKYRRNEK